MKFIRFAFILGFGFSALYHLFFAFIPKMGDPSTGERHLLFVVINFIAFLIMTFNQRKWLLGLVPLIMQQLYSHGLFLYQQWRDYNEIDWPSVIVLIAMPFLGYYIFSSWNKKSR